MTRIVFILLFFSNISIGQTLTRIKEALDLEVHYQSENVLEKYQSFDYDFSNVWSVNENKNIYGIIGEPRSRAIASRGPEHWGSNCPTMLNEP